MTGTRTLDVYELACLAGGPRRAGSSMGWRQRRRTVAAGLCLLVLAALLGGCTPTAESPPAAARSADDTAGRAARSDELLERTLPADEPGCSAAVGIEGEVMWAGARGLADLATKRTLTPATTLDIASVSKQFTATAVLLLAGEGRLALTDPLSRWVPGLPTWSDQVTIDQLLHHTSAIPDYGTLLSAAGYELSDPTTQQQALAVIARTPSLNGRLQGMFRYSNSNYLLLAEVVASAGQQPLPEFAHTRIFEPLALDMAIDPSGAHPDNTDPSSARSYVYDRTRERWEAAGSRWEQIGDGSVQTTPSELVRWADTYRTGRLGGRQLVDAQLHSTTTAGPGEDRYAAGIEVAADGALSHDGGWAGFLTNFRVSADHRIAVAVSCNRVADRSPSDIEGITDQLRAEWADA
jgi:CubicO group peptidase (beta-lactamase class C family)